MLKGRGTGNQETEVGKALFVITSNGPLGDFVQIWALEGWTPKPTEGRTRVRGQARVPLNCKLWLPPVPEVNKQDVDSLPRQK